MDYVGCIIRLLVDSVNCDFSDSSITTTSDGKIELVVNYSIRVAIPIVNAKKDLKLTKTKLDITKNNESVLLCRLVFV